MMVHPIFTYLVGLLCAEGLRIPDNSGLDPDDGENPALSGWTEMDGILARAFEDQGGNNWSKTSKPVQSYVDTQTFCRTSPMVNVILPRYDGINADMDLHREYSVTDSSPPAAEAGTCTSVDDLLRAVKLGRRVWKHGRADEKKPSHFVAKGCAVPQFEPTVFQRVLSTQSSIGLRGDSLTRHLMMGLTLRYTDNYYDGGMSHASSQWANCTCDGQFSEAVICRKLARIHPDVDKLRWDKGGKKKTTCGKNGLPSVYWLQGGAHYGSNMSEFLGMFLYPTISRIKKHKSTCSSRPLIFVEGLNAQSRSLDRKYPHQSRENALTFNDQLVEAFANDDGVRVVDFWNLTLDAQSSDGYHYLTDVNSVKADVVVAIVDMIIRSR